MHLLEATAGTFSGKRQSQSYRTTALGGSRTGRLDSPSPEQLTICSFSEHRHLPQAGCSHLAEDSTYTARRSSFRINEFVRKRIRATRPVVPYDTIFPKPMK